MTLHRFEVEVNVPDAVVKAAKGTFGDDASDAGSWDELAELCEIALANDAGGVEVMNYVQIGAPS